VIIYMTDGQNWIHDGQTKKEQVKIDNEVIEKCQDAKDAGIEMFTVGFDINAHTKKFLTDCSSGTDHYFFPTGAADLKVSFKQIGEQVSSILTPRIAK